MSGRSTMGCNTCKNRRKKCDETKPECQRCIASGIICAYEYVEGSGTEGRIRRTRPAPRSNNSVQLAKTPWNAPQNTPRPTGSLPTYGDLAFIDHLALRERWNGESHQYPDLAYPGDVSGSMSSLASSSAHSHLQYDFDFVEALNSSKSYPRSIGSSGVSDVALSNYALAPMGSIGVIHDNKIDDTDKDDKGVRGLLCRAPNMDKNVKDNSLPFVLQCYSQWAVVGIFDPLEVMHGIRDRVIQRFLSKDTRIRTILVANIMKELAHSLVTDDKTTPILVNLALEVQRTGSSFMTKLSKPILEVDRQRALRILDHAFEVFLLQSRTQPITVVIKLLDHISPIFRCACPGEPGRPINLPNIMLGSAIGLRYLACVDIFHSVLSGKPTYFRYEVPFSLDLCDELQNCRSFQSIEGIPDQFTVFFAWVNSLCETPGASSSPALIDWVENILPQIKVSSSETSDPLLRAGRIVVQECWRFAAYIYFYMVFCRADACDDRVARAQQGIMYLVRGLKPARNPDAFLTPLMVAAVATTKENDRNAIRLRYLGVREPTERGTLPNECLLVFEDIWGRTREEGRPAVWSDLRIAVRRVTGK